MRSLAIVACGLFAVSALAEAPDGQTTLRGEVLLTPGAAHDHEAPVKLRTGDGAEWTLLVEVDHYHTLHDPKLAGRGWEFIGNAKPGNRLEVIRVFSIKDGVRHKVQYYCEICHIVSYRPGQCMCCQEEVELQEKPAEPAP